MRILMRRRVWLSWILCLGLLVSAPVALDQWGLAAQQAESGNQSECPAGDASGSAQEGARAEAAVATRRRGPGGAHSLVRRLVTTADAALRAPWARAAPPTADVSPATLPSPLFLDHSSLLC